MVADNAAIVIASDSSPVNFYVPFGIATDTNSNLLVASLTDDPSNPGSVIFSLVPATGAKSLIAKGFDIATNIAVSSNGTIYVNDFLAHGGGLNAIISVNPVTNERVTIIRGGIFPVGAGQLGAMVIAPDGSILTTDTYPINSTDVRFYGRIVQTDPVSGNQTVIFSVPNRRLEGLAIEPKGSLLVAVNRDGGESQVLRVDPLSVTSTVLSTGGLLDNLRGLTIDQQGNVFVLSPASVIGGVSSVIKVDPVSGNQTAVSSGGLLTFPIGLTFDGNGNLYVVDIYATGKPPVAVQAGNGAVFRINTSTGLQNIVALGSRFLPNAAPVCSSAKAFPPVVGAPNHQFVPVIVTGVSDPDDDAITITVTGVTQDEPVNSRNDGNTAPDAVIQDGAVSVRAKRSGKGNGRVYEISFNAEDGKGGLCAGTVKVNVPHSLNKGLLAIDDGQVYDSTVP